MTKVRKITVDYEKCNRKGECVETCTQLVWTWKRKGLKKYPHAEYPERCIVCEKCRDVCPVDAIGIEIDEKAFIDFLIKH